MKKLFLILSAIALFASCQKVTFEAPDESLLIEPGKCYYQVINNMSEMKSELFDEYNNGSMFYVVALEVSSEGFVVKQTQLPNLHFEGGKSSYIEADKNAAAVVVSYKYAPDDDRKFTLQKWVLHEGEVVKVNIENSTMAGPAFLTF